MNKLANVEYFMTKCNQLLGTTYTINDWGGSDNVKKAINIEWITHAVTRVYNEIHEPKTKTTVKHYNCSLLLSSKFNINNAKIAVSEEIVNSVVSYLINLNKICDNDCACYKDLNCQCQCENRNCFCNRTCEKNGGGSNRIYWHCNCAGYPYGFACNCNCACECGSNTECVCDCSNYDCNCEQVLNCSYGSARPMTENCGWACQCNCVCECDCDCGWWWWLLFIESNCACLNMVKRNYYY